MSRGVASARNRSPGIAGSKSERTLRKCSRSGPARLGRVIVNKVLLTTTRAVKHRCCFDKTTRAHEAVVTIYFFGARRIVGAIAYESLRQQFGSGRQNETKLFKQARLPFRRGPKSTALFSDRSNAAIRVEQPSRRRRSKGSRFVDPNKLISARLPHRSGSGGVVVEVPVKALTLRAA